MKKTLLLIPVLLLLTSCQGEVMQPREEMLRETCARFNAGQFSNEGAASRLGLRLLGTDLDSDYNKSRIRTFCAFYKQGG